MSDLTPAEQAIRDALAAEFWEFPPGSTCLYRSSQHGIHHRYDGACAICRGDLASIARVAVAAVRPVIAAEELRNAAATIDGWADGSDAYTNGSQAAAYHLRHRADQIERDAQTTTHTGGDETT